MKAFTDILTILNLCIVQFYGKIDSQTSLQQSVVPAVIFNKQIRADSRKPTEPFKSKLSASLSQKCLHAGTGIIAFISINEQLEDPFQTELKLDRYKPLLEQLSLYSDPSVVLLQINIATPNRHDLIFDWIRLPINSQLLIFDAETIYRPTIDHGPSLQVVFDNRTVIWSKISSVKAAETIKQTKQPKLDLKGRFIHLIAGIPPNRKISDCSLNEDKLLTHAELCMIHILEKQINFTTIPFPERPKYIPHRLYNIQADNYVNNVIISKEVPGLQWLPHGVKFEPYKLILVSKLHSVNVDSLLQPFDRNIWMAIVSANCFFVFVVCVGNKLQEKSKLILWMISTILSQTDEMLTQHLFNKKRLINIALVSSWFFLMFLLNVLYTGDLYSCLSNVRLPVLPNSLREILVTNIPLFTFGQFCSSSDKGDCSSILLNLLIPDILKTKDAHENLKNVANNVLNKTEHIPGTPFFVSLDIAINSDRLRTLKRAVTTNKFGMLASSKFIDEFKILARILFTEHVVRQTHDTNPFISMIPWITQRGPFASAFSSGIGRLSQSGLVDRWNKHILIMKVILITKTRFKSMHDLENKLVDESTKREVMIGLVNDSFKWEGSGRFYSKLMLAPDKISMLASEEPVPLAVMKLPFLACHALAFFAIVVFLIECVAANLRLRKKSQSPVNKILNDS
jgi:hypothetical protein